MIRFILVLMSFVLPLAASETFQEDKMVRTKYAVKDGQLVNKDHIATLPPEDHYRLAGEAFDNGNWIEAAKQYTIVSLNFPDTPFGQDANFYLGVALVHLGEFDFANDSLNKYLSGHKNPQFFIETMQYKINIAEQFRAGAKRHYFGTRYMPKWGDGNPLALEIYDEVIAAVPSHEIAAQALFSKGCLQWDLKEYNDSIESFQMVIRRFPKHEFAPESYLFINKIYLEKCKRELQNSDLLALAKINLKRFKEDFPQEERLVEAEADVLAIKEQYAKGLFETGKFYEKMSKPFAAVLYYKKAMHDFPDTDVASQCKGRIEQLEPST